MKIDIAVVADEAKIEGGKLSILGIFDQVNANSFPARHARMYLVLRFDVHPSEFGTKQKVDVQLVDEDGKKVLEMKGELTPDPGPAAQVPPGVTVHLPLLMEFKKLVFQKAGRYAFNVLINGSFVTSVSLTLKGP